jgi:threonine dehydrogenase-like Zn-dependent dehydrogenase
MAERMGADAVVDPGREDPAGAVRAIAGREPDVIFECVGVPGTINDAIQLCPIQGRVVVAGVCAEQDTFFPLLGIIKEVELKFVLAYRKDEFQAVIDALADGSLPAGPLITDVMIRLAFLRPSGSSPGPPARRRWSSSLERA